MNVNPSTYWTQFVNATMSQRRCGYGEASRITAGAHPDAATLMSAFGRSRQSVEFFNSREAAKPTPEKASAKKEITQFVNEKMKSGLHYNAAYNAVAREHPNLFGGKSKGIQFVNVTGTDGKDGQPPAATSELKKLFWLPEHTTQAQFEAGFKGNGSTLSPLNPAKIFAGLVDLAQQGSSLDYDSAIAQTKAAFPDLWASVALLSQEPV